MKILKLKHLLDHSHWYDYVFLWLMRLLCSDERVVYSWDAALSKSKHQLPLKTYVDPRDPSDGGMYDVGVDNGQRLLVWSRGYTAQRKYKG